jgi:hypothetical protein
MRPPCVQLAADVLRLAARQDPLALSRAIDLAAAVLEDAATAPQFVAEKRSRFYAPTK